METLKMDKRFFESTRGRIVTILRGSTCTVEELASQLDLTDNAVRAHLLALERDGLVRQSGMRRGLRKPHFTYSLTPEAEGLFPKAYDALLNQLIAVLKNRLSPAQIEEVLREVGRYVASDAASETGESDLESRLQTALKVLAAIGGAAVVEEYDDKIVICSSGCPLAAVVAVHPEVCRLAETLIREIVKSPVTEHCDRAGAPKCRFEIAR